MGKTNYLLPSPLPFSNSLWEEKEGIKKVGRRTRFLRGNWRMEKLGRTVEKEKVFDGESKRRKRKLEQWTEEKEFLKC
jgi:hypothetical protein